MTGLDRRQLIAGAVSLGALWQVGLAKELLKQSSTAPLSDAQILKLLQERIEARQAVGLAIGIVDKQGERIVTCGKLGISDPRPIASDTVFGIASVTKPFIALLLAEAVLRGELAYDSPASRYLPSEVSLPSRGGREIKVIDLATHASGLPHDLPSELAQQARQLDERRAQKLMYDYLASYELNADPGSTWSYSNLGYALLGTILVHRTGLDYARLIRDRITGVLGMDSTAPVVSPTMAGRRASPHLASLEPSPEWHKPWMNAVLQSTTRDLLKFVSACLGVRRTRLDQAFAATLKATRDAPALNAQQALAWYVYPFDGQPLIGHSGGGGGFAATIMFDPNAETGITLLSNTEFMQQDLAQHILRDSLTLDPIQKEYSLESAALDRFVGDYRDANGAVAGIRRQGNGLLLLMPAGHKAPLTPQGPTTFFVRGFARLTASFEADANGNVTTLHWVLNGVTTTAVR